MEQITIVLCLTRWTLLCIAEDARGLPGLNGEPDRAAEFVDRLMLYLASEEDEAAADEVGPGDGEPQKLVITVSNEHGPLDESEFTLEDAELVQAAIQELLASGAVSSDSRRIYSVMQRSLILLLNEIVAFLSALSNRADLAELITHMRGVSIGNALHEHDVLVLNRWTTLRGLCADIIEQQILSLHLMLEIYLKTADPCEERDFPGLLKQIVAAHPMFNAECGCACDRVAELDRLEPAVLRVFERLTPSLSPDSDVGASVVIDGEQITANDVENLLPGIYRLYREIAA